MKAIVLAGGYAKRMWPLTMNQPKHLLPIAGKPMLDYVLKELETLPDLDKIYLSTNERFSENFKEFIGRRDNKKEIELIIEPTKNEDEKLGSLGALGMLVNDKKIDDTTLIIGGDNLFEFRMIDLIAHLEKYNENILVAEDVKQLDKAKLYGVVEVGPHHKILSFEEKPQNPKSTLIATACYVLTPEGVKGLLRYLEEGNDPDKMGHFIQWFIQNHIVYAFKFDGRWFDIGSIESYHNADKYFQEHREGF